jgi:hypothetical protein
MSVNWEVRTRRLAEYHEKRKRIESAFLTAEAEWKKQGIQPGAFTAFIAGYEAAMDRAIELAKAVNGKEAA